MPAYLKWLIWLLLTVIVSVSAAGLWLVMPMLSDPEPGFMARKGLLVDSRLEREWRTADAYYQDLQLVSSSGLRVAVNIRRPALQQRPLPVAVLLGGYGTGRQATGLIEQPGDIILVALSYPYTGERDLQGLAALINIPAIQQALLDVTPAVLLTLDYLQQQAYVDTQQMELIGVSLGAFFASIPAALDQRISRLWLVQGAGDPVSVYDYRLRQDIDSPVLRHLLAWWLGLATGSEQLRAERWVGRVAPRPVVVVNSRADVAVPMQAVHSLHAALQQPSEIIWLEGEHVRPSRKDVLQQLTAVVLHRIARETSPETPPRVGH